MPTPTERQEDLERSAIPAETEDLGPHEPAAADTARSPEEWWWDEATVARLRELYLPDFHRRLQMLAERRGTDEPARRFVETQLGESFQRATGNEDDYGLIDSRLRRESFPGLVDDLALWLARTIGQQSRNFRKWSGKVGSRSSPQEEYERTPWEFPPDIHLDRISPDGAWRGDPELLEELALYQTEFLNRIVPVVGERQELLNAVGNAAPKLGLSVGFNPWEMRDIFPEAADQRARLDAALEAFTLQAAEAMRRRGLEVREP